MLLLLIRIGIQGGFVKMSDLGPKTINLHVENFEAYFRDQTGHFRSFLGKQLVLGHFWRFFLALFENFRIIIQNNSIITILFHEEFIRTFLFSTFSY